jgi:hypothetical protein
MSSKVHLLQRIGLELSSGEGRQVSVVINTDVLGDYGAASGKGKQRWPRSLGTED